MRHRATQPSTTLSGLPPELVDVLLADTPSPEVVHALRGKGVLYNWLVQFEHSAEQIQTLRQEHRGALVAEAHRRGLPAAHIRDVLGED